LTDTANRPYIGWIFNEPSDNHTANCLWNDYNMTKLHDDWNEESDNVHLITAFDDRGYSIRIKDEHHFEFRCFDMVRNVRDLKDHFKFVSAYMAYIEKETLYGKKIAPQKLKKCVKQNYWKKVEYYNYNKKKVLQEFQQLLTLIGLDYKDYRRFVERNFLVRYNTYGKTHLL
jgi:hypothetical protein